MFGYGTNICTQFPHSLRWNDPQVSDFRYEYPPKGPSVSMRQGTYSEAFTNKLDVAQHVLCDCEALVELIFSHLDKHFMKPGIPLSKKLFLVWGY